MKFWISVSHQGLNKYHVIWGNSTCKDVRVSSPSRPKHLLDDLNEESVISLGIITHDTQRQMLTNNIYLLMYL